MSLKKKSCKFCFETRSFACSFFHITVRWQHTTLTHWLCIRWIPKDCWCTYIVGRQINIIWERRHILSKYKRAAVTLYCSSRYGLNPLKPCQITSQLFSTYGYPGHVHCITALLQSSPALLSRVFSSGEKKQHVEKGQLNHGACSLYGQSNIQCILNIVYLYIFVKGKMINLFLNVSLYC